MHCDLLLNVEERLRACLVIPSRSCCAPASSLVFRWNALTSVSPRLAGVVVLCLEVFVAVRRFDFVVRSSECRKLHSEFEAVSLTRFFPVGNDFVARRLPLRVPDPWPRVLARARRVLCQVLLCGYLGSPRVAVHGPFAWLRVGRYARIVESLWSSRGCFPLFPWCAGQFLTESAYL